MSLPAVSTAACCQPVFDTLPVMLPNKRCNLTLFCTHLYARMQTPPQFWHGSVASNTSVSCCISDPTQTCACVASLCAAGGLYTYIRSGCAESLQVGMGAAALLSICAIAMSDMTDGPDGHLAVKAAWGESYCFVSSERMSGLRRSEPLWLASARAAHCESCCALHASG